MDTNDLAYGIIKVYGIAYRYHVCICVTRYGTRTNVLCHWRIVHLSGHVAHVQSRKSLQGLGLGRVNLTGHDPRIYTVTI